METNTISQVDGPLALILDHSCASETLGGGWKLFAIETHCVEWTVEARRMHSYETTLAPLWEIRRMTARDV